MTWRWLVAAGLSGLVAFVSAFVLVNLAYLKWAGWRHPENSSMSGLGAGIMGLIIAPICALLTFGLVLSFGAKKHGG